MFNSQRDGITARELADLKENLKIDIKSLLCSSKEGLTDRELKLEYKNFNGYPPPFAALGYNSLYELMRNMPELCSIRKHFSGTWIYLPVFDEKTIALGVLVRGQSDHKKKVREKSRCLESVRQNRSASRFYNSSIQKGYNQYNSSTYRPDSYSSMFRKIRYKSGKVKFDTKYQNIIYIKIIKF